MNLNTEEWKWFKFIDLFIFESGSDYTAIKAKDFPGENNFIGSSAFNNGVTVRTSLPNKRIGNCITVAKDGSVGSAFYQKKDFSINGHVTILRLKNYKLNENIGLFLRVLIELEKPKYNFNRAWSLNRMQKSELKLPVTEEGSPDWNFMEEYMNYINLQPKDIPKLKAPTLELKTEEWKEFKLIDIFKISSSKTTPKNNLIIGGEYEYVTTRATNNGVDFLTNIYTEKEHCISVDSATDGISFVRYKKFCSSDHVEILTPILNISYEVMEFINILLQLSMFKYSYSRKRSQTRLKKETINLPVTKEGNPDWDFMEEYMNQINLQ